MLSCSVMSDPCDPPLSVGFPRQKHWSGLPFSFSRGSSPPRVWTWVSCIASRLFTTEPPEKPTVVVTIHPSASCRTPINKCLALIQCDWGWWVWNDIKVSWQHFCISPPLNYLGLTIILATGPLFMKRAHSSHHHKELQIVWLEEISLLFKCQRILKI